MPRVGDANMFEYCGKYRGGLRKLYSGRRVVELRVKENMEILDFIRVFIFFHSFSNFGFGGFNFV